MILIYKVFMIEKNNLINIDIFTFDTYKIKTELYHYCIGDITQRTMLHYIKCNDYRMIYYLLRNYIIDNPTLQYDQECLFCISTKEYTFNFTLNEIMNEEENNEKKNN